MKHKNHSSIISLDVVAKMFIKLLYMTYNIQSLHLVLISWASGARSEYYVLGGLSPGHGKCGSASLYRGSGWSPQRGSRADPPVGVWETKPPEAESSVAFEVFTDEPNLTLLFLQLSCCIYFFLYIIIFCYCFSE